MSASQLGKSTAICHAEWWKGHRIDKIELIEKATTQNDATLVIQLKINHILSVDVANEEFQRKKHIPNILSATSVCIQL